MPLSVGYRTADLHGMSQMIYALYGKLELATAYRSAIGWKPAPIQPQKPKTNDKTKPKPKAKGTVKFGTSEGY